MQSSTERPSEEQRTWMVKAIKAVDIASWIVFVLWLWLPNGTHWISVLLNLVLLWIVLRSLLLVGVVQKKPHPSHDRDTGPIGEP